MCDQAIEGVKYFEGGREYREEETPIDSYPIISQKSYGRKDGDNKRCDAYGKDYYLNQVEQGSWGCVDDRSCFLQIWYIFQFPLVGRFTGIDRGLAQGEELLGEPSDLVFGNAAEEAAQNGRILY